MALLKLIDNSDVNNDNTTPSSLLIPPTSSSLATVCFQNGSLTLDRILSTVILGLVYGGTKGEGRGWKEQVMGVKDGICTVFLTSFIESYFWFILLSIPYCWELSLARRRESKWRWWELWAWIIEVVVIDLFLLLINSLFFPPIKSLLSFPHMKLNPDMTK